MSDDSQMNPVTLHKPPHITPPMCRKPQVSWFRRNLFAARERAASRVLWCWWIEAKEILWSVNVGAMWQWRCISGCGGTKMLLFLSYSMRSNSIPGATSLFVSIHMFEQSPKKYVIIQKGKKRKKWEERAAEWWIMYQRTKASIKANVLCFWTGKQRRCQVTGGDLRALEMNYDSDLERCQMHIYIPLTAKG